MTKKFEKLTPTQWNAISEFFNTKRKRKLDLKSVLDGIFYILRTGCQWRNLPSEYPHWRAVNYYFEQWKKDGTLFLANIKLNQLDRQKEGKEATPSVLCVDTQSVKLASFIEEDRGIDANKKVNGRKRQFFVDTGGRLWVGRVHAANLHDGQEAIPLLDECQGFDSRI